MESLRKKTIARMHSIFCACYCKDDFPRIWVPSWENRDVRQLLWHRHRMVQTRTRIMNQLQVGALNEGLRYKNKKLWCQDRLIPTGAKLDPTANVSRITDIA